MFDEARKSAIQTLRQEGFSRELPLSDRSELIGSIAILSDGVYAWPKDLAYYVERYRIGLTAECLDHMRTIKP
jgi:hypothetical protein